MAPTKFHELTRRSIFAAFALLIPRMARANPAYVVAAPCIGVKDTACIDACPVDAIHPKKDEADFKNQKMVYIDPVECIDCGACVPVCPVSAIFALDDLPKKWAQYRVINANYYNRGNQKRPPRKADKNKSN